MTYLKEKAIFMDFIDESDLTLEQYDEKGKDDEDFEKKVLAAFHDGQF